MLGKTDFFLLPITGSHRRSQCLSDISVIPMHVSSHIQCLVYAMAERVRTSLQI